MAAVVAEAKMHRRFGFHGLEHAVDRFRRPFPFVRASGKVRFVDLHDFGVNVFHLCRERVGDRKGEIGKFFVVLVEQRLRKHVRAGNRKLERLVRERAGALIGLRQVQRAGRDGAVDDARRARAEPHRALRTIFDEFVERDRGANARHRLHEVLDHAIGLGMVHVEARKLSVADEVDAGLLLRMKHDPRRVDHGLLRGKRYEPFRHRIGADDGGKNSRCI